MDKNICRDKEENGIKYKLCSYCNTFKEQEKFKRSSLYKDGFSYNCKPCINIRNKDRYHNNKEKIYGKQREWVLKNKDKVFKKYKDRKQNPDIVKRDKEVKNTWKQKNSDKIKENNKKYGQRNRKWITDKNRIKRQTDPQTRIRHNLRSRLSKVI
jgi:hypothetical protein